MLKNYWLEKESFMPYLINFGQIYEIHCQIYRAFFDLAFFFAFCCIDNTDFCVELNSNMEWMLSALLLLNIHKNGLCTFHTAKIFSVNLDITELHLSLAHNSINNTIFSPQTKKAWMFLLAVLQHSTLLSPALHLDLAPIITLRDFQ